MLAEERFSLIMEQLNRKRTVTVQELCEALNTSALTTGGCRFLMSHGNKSFLLPFST